MNDHDPWNLMSFLYIWASLFMVKFDIILLHLSIIDCVLNFWKCTSDFSWYLVVQLLILLLKFVHQVRKRCGSEMLAFLKRWKEAAKVDPTWKDPYKVLNDSSGNYHRVRWCPPPRTSFFRFWGYLEALLHIWGFENIRGLRPLRSDINDYSWEKLEAYGN